MGGLGNRSDARSFFKRFATVGTSASIFADLGNAESTAMARAESLRIPSAMHLARLML